MRDAPEPSGETRRLLILAVVVLGLLLGLHFTPLRAWLDDVQALKGFVQGYGWLAYVGYAVASISLIALGVPRLVLCSLAGALFGFVAGALLALFSALAGSYGAFLIARWSGRDWAERKLASASVGLKNMLADPSIGSIFIARQMPVPGLLINVLIGVLPTSHGTFLAGTLLGYVPSTLIVALAGSSLGKESLATAMTQVTLAMAALGGFSALLIWIRAKPNRE